MMNARTLLAVSAIAGTLMSAGCGDSPAAPSRHGVVTFDVHGETFRVALTSSDQLSAARDAQNGGHARIPSGSIVAGTDVNVGWSWHLEDLTFVETTIELCDGRPSDVERQGVRFAAGRFCPWSAIVVRIDP